MASMRVSTSRSAISPSVVMDRNIATMLRLQSEPATINGALLGNVEFIAMELASAKPSKANTRNAIDAVGRRSWYRSSNHAMFGSIVPPFQPRHDLKLLHNLQQTRLGPEVRVR